MPLFTEQRNSLRAATYRATAEIEIGKLVGLVLAGRTYPHTYQADIELHRLSIVTARQSATEFGFHDNDIIAAVFSGRRVPHARSTIIGPVTPSNHPGLANTIGVFRKNARRGIDLTTDKGRIALDALSRNIDRQTPDAHDIERRGLILDVLNKVGVKAELTAQLSQEGYPIIEALGNEYPLVLTPNSEAQNTQEWTSPYQTLDFNGRAA